VCLSFCDRNAKFQENLVNCKNLCKTFTF
jgi:hypothetical protein